MLTHYFVDESGDPVFYDKVGRVIVGRPGCSPILLIGLMRTDDPKPIRVALEKLRSEIAADKYFQEIPSLQKSLLYFHAKDDCPEIREKVFKQLINLNFKAEFIVARKKEDIFIKRHHRKIQEFYDDMIIKLFENKLHKQDSKIYFAQRGDRKRQEPIENAVIKARLKFEKKWDKKINTDYDIKVQTPIGEPCLQVIDYMNWAVQRAFIKKETRFLNFMMEKISYLVDIYDFNKYPKNFYNQKNKFDLNKISPL
ncbi:MAG: DUF3800 domain-containing protein [Patescibacteria group bacterium]|nr:DUF3800 domain-containing protein [Patescibacteria group bacterium]MDD5121739.1 DUF3800 domain-containing protein [Patescibacteria group bacterium]MDD5222286.1 DUF3800 domain-containing protein [Patescibacteria group bacterium]MDD5396409.1 DUF3800 domain-containing protein [Patescibacteria group bacterium]